MMDGTPGAGSSGKGRHSGEPANRGAARPRLLIVFGTRPEVIKLASVVIEARRQNERFEVIALATGQHREMLEQAMSAFGIEPDLNLELMQPNQDLAGLGASALLSVSKVIRQVRADWVVVQGDTTTAFAAALAAYYTGTRIAHVEAGLRTGRLDSPYPEEGNRQLIGRLATLHFVPTPSARQNLLAEGISESRIVPTGNTVVDAIDLICRKWGDDSQPALPRELADLRPGFMLVTCHRREHFGDGLHAICLALKQIARQHPNRTLVFPVHLNPNVRGVVHARLGGIPNIRLIDPVDYETTLRLLAGASLVLTDSGGIQEEAPSFGVPVVVMREHTERTEGIADGFAVLAGVRTEDIVRHAEMYLSDPLLGERLRGRPNPYGDGRAAQRILDALAQPVAAGASAAAALPVELEAGTAGPLAA